MAKMLRSIVQHPISRAVKSPQYRQLAGLPFTFWLVILDALTTSIVLENVELRQDA